MNWKQEADGLAITCPAEMPFATSIVFTIDQGLYDARLLKPGVPEVPSFHQNNYQCRSGVLRGESPERIEFL